MHKEFFFIVNLKFLAAPLCWLLLSRYLLFYYFPFYAIIALTFQFESDIVVTGGKDMGISAY
jgi:hypothetical protein